MKKIYLFIPMIFIILSGPLHAQLDAGKLMVGVASTFNTDIFSSDLMSLSFSSSKTKYSYGTSDPDKFFNFNIIPRVGYIFLENLAAGLDVYISRYGQSFGDDAKYTETWVSAVPFVRYYYPLLWSYPFVEINGGIGTQRYKRTEPGGGSGNIDSKYSTSTISGVIGIAKPIGNRATFDIMAGYSRNSLKYETDQKYISGSFIIRMGIVVFFLQQEPQN